MMFRTNGLRILPIVLTAGLLAAAAPGTAHAAWSNDPDRPLRVGLSGSEPVGACSDGEGGVLVCWLDWLGSAYALRVQRVSPEGEPLWPTGGVEIVTTASGFFPWGYPKIVSDGAGGAIVVFLDRRNWGAGWEDDLFAQHLDAAGLTTWTVGGVPVCSVDGDVGTFDAAADGSGGVFTAWTDERMGGGVYNLYGQHLGAGGTASWAAGGVSISSAAGSQFGPSLGTLSNGHAVCVWTDFRTGVGDIYGAQLDPIFGVVAPLNGWAVCPAAGEQRDPRIVAVSDFDEVMVGWEDFRAGNWDIYAGLIDEVGTLFWGPAGLSVCVAAGNQTDVVGTSDGSGGGILAWTDRRGATLPFAQRIENNGFASWALNGIPLGTIGLDSYEDAPTATSDENGGAIVGWLGMSSGVYSLFGQRVGPDGALQWAASGRPIMNDVNWFAPVAVSDGGGGAFFVACAESTSVQHVTPRGCLGDDGLEIISVRDVPNDEGGRVKLSWSADCAELDQSVGVTIGSYWVWRSVPPNQALSALRRGATLVTMDSPDVPSDARRILTTRLSGLTTYWEFVTSLPPGGFDGYSYTASTTSDSTDGSNPYTLFLIQSRDAAGSVRAVSEPDSGYSVDNLAPSAPGSLVAWFHPSDGSQGLAAQSGSYVSLHWMPNREADLSGYRIYGGSTPDFEIGPQSLLATVPDTGFADHAGHAYYRVGALDAHGNAGLTAARAPQLITGGVEGGASAELSFAAPLPNPASDHVTFRLTLPHDATVELAVFDAFGRRVRNLITERKAAGSHTFGWSLISREGIRVPPGVYYVRFRADKQTLTRTVAVAR